VGPLHYIRVSVSSVTVRFACLLAGLCIARPALAHPGSGIVVDRHGNVFFVVYGTNVIMKLDRSGKATRLVDDERLRLPHHLVLGADGSLYSASDFDGRIWRIGADGSLTEYFNSNRVPRPARGQKEVYVGMGGDPFTLDSAGNVYALATGLDSAIIRITLDGKVTPIAVNAPFRGLHMSSMTFGADGALYVTDQNRVWRVAGDSVAAIVPRGTQLSYATGVAVDSGGNIYVADYRAGRIVRLERDSTSAARAVEVMRVDDPFGVTVAGTDVYVLATPGGGVSVLRLRDGKVERLYGSRDSRTYLAWFMLTAVVSLPLLIAIAIYRRLSQRRRA
jgi:sugar lactone lactonase YvrE